MFKLNAGEALNEFVDMNNKIFEVQGMDAEARTTTLKKWIDALLAKYKIDTGAAMLEQNRNSSSCKL